MTVPTPDDDPVFGDFADTAAELGELVVADAPSGLLASVLTAARSRRAPGAAAGPPPETIDARAIFNRTVEVLDRLLGELSPAEWVAPTGLAYGRVRDVIAHLVGVEELFVGWLDGTGDPVPDHRAGTADAIAALHDVAAADLLARWRRAVAAVRSAAAGLPDDRPVLLFDLPATLDGALTIRAFEVWTHTEDICRALERPLPGLDAARALAMSSRFAAALPIAVALRRGALAPSGVVRLVVIGDGGGTYDVHLGSDGERDATLVVDVLDLCRAAAERLDLATPIVHVEGDRELVADVIASVGAFARD